MIILLLWCATSRLEQKRFAFSTEKQTNHVLLQETCSREHWDFPDKLPSYWPIFTEWAYPGVILALNPAPHTHTQKSTMIHWWGGYAGLAVPSCRWGGVGIAAMLEALEHLARRGEWGGAGGKAATLTPSWVPPSPTTYCVMPAKEVAPFPAPPPVIPLSG